MKLDVRGVRLNVICPYAPQVGCEEEESLWIELDQWFSTFLGCGPAKFPN